MRKFLTTLIISMTGILLIASCNGDGGDDYSGDDFNGQQAVSVAADLSGAKALFTVQDDSSSADASISSKLLPNKEVTISQNSSLKKMSVDGVVNALYATGGGDNPMDDLPHLSFVAVSPTYDVIFAFERCFIYRTTDDDGNSINDATDAWSCTSAFTCQLFKSPLKLNEYEEGGDPQPLECITNSLELNTWDFRSKLFQFDAAGNGYFSAHVPNNWKDFLIKWNADEAIGSDNSLEYVINSNICYRDFIITDAGGLLYTGIVSTDGDCGGGDSFLRFKTPEGELQQVTQGWWDYTFAPVESGQFDGQILFYGPDPSVATVPDWDDSCLFIFDPEAESGSRSTKIANCDVNVWQLLNEAATEAAKAEYCASEDYMMGGGNQPDKILLANLAEDDDNEKEFYVIGNIYKKLAGSIQCDICVNSGVACVDSNGKLTADLTEGPCIANAGAESWKSSGSHTGCYNNNTSGACSLGDTMPDEWTINYSWCQQTDSDWTATYASAARVNYDPEAPEDNTIAILSSTASDVVSNGWVIESLDSDQDDVPDGLDRFVYNAFDVDAGEYILAEITYDDQVANLPIQLLTGYEVYEIFRDPRDSARWFINALRFSDNQYVMASFDPDDADPSSTLVLEEDIQGQIETLVIMPDALLYSLE